MERGLYLTALRESAKYTSSPSLRDDVAKIHTTVSENLDAIIKQHRTKIEDTANENRYGAYLALENIAENFGNSAPGKAANEAIAKHRSAQWISDEEKALSDYQSIMRRAARADDERSLERIKTALLKLAKEYPETLHGRIAASSAQ